LRRHLPALPIVDITHDISPGDVRAGSLALERAVPYLPEGVVVAVVDPGVGTARRGVAVQVRGAELTLVGPDNGLLVPAATRLGGIATAVTLQPVCWPGTRSRVSSDGIGGATTFDGRDLFAPAAALLAGGTALAHLGPAIDPTTLARLPTPVCRAGPGGSLEAEVTWVDRYGNVQLAAGLGRLPVGLSLAPLLCAPAGQAPRRAKEVHTFADLGPGQLGVLVDSYGRLALCLNGASAAAELGVIETDIVVLSRAPL
jgi:S-adenosyl-L-methionine hydrolase (adenosine-forming)